MLPEAIRHSPNEAAQCRLPDGSTLLVKRITGEPEKYTQEGYAVSIQHGHHAPEELFASDDLAEALDRLGEMRLAGLDGVSMDWQPADTNVDTWAP